jgi:membrane-bound ClpP family serine protease
MTAMILLFAVGVLLLAAEVILPGGVAGVIGGILMLSGCGVAFSQLGPTGGAIAVAAALAFTALVLFIEFRVLPKTRLGKRAFLQAAITGVSAPTTEELSSLIGKPAVAMTTLAPSGYVMVDGLRREAFCRSGHAEKGARLEVIGSESLRLIVTQKNHA